MTAVSATSISLSWNTPRTHHDDPVISYIVQYRPKTITGRDFHHDVTAGFREIRDVTGMEYDVSGLEAFTEYELRVISVNSVGRSPASHSVDATTSQLGIASEILNKTVIVTRLLGAKMTSNISIDYYSVNWSPSDMPSDEVLCKLSFIIIYRSTVVLSSF